MEILQVDASLVNPDDLTEVNVVAAVAGVGKTHRLSTGQVIRWTPEWLRAHASDFVGKPVNVRIGPTGKATNHTRDPIGAIKEAHYDEEKQAVIVTASLWEHYRPSTIQQLRKLYKEGDLHVSMEMKYPEGSLLANEDGSHTPTEGTFSGMGFVGQAGDPRSMVYLMAALDEDEDRKDKVSVSDMLREIAAKILGLSEKTELELQAKPLSSESRNDLPDSSFACPEQRKYPVKHKDGSIDLPHLRNALARVSDSNNDQCGKETIMALAKKYLNKEERAALMSQEALAAHAGSFEWLMRNLQDHLQANRSSSGEDSMPAYAAVIATYPNYAIYAEGDSYFRIDYKRSGDKLNFGEPQEVDPVYQPTAKASAEANGDDSADDTGNQNQGESNTMSATPEELLAAKDSELAAKNGELAELKAAFETVTNTLNEMKAAQDAKDAEAKANAQADERLAELEKINDAPLKDETKTALRESLKTIDDAAFNAVKSAYAAAAEIRAGVGPTGQITNPNEPGTNNNPQAVKPEELKNLQAEASEWKSQYTGKNEE